jgi:hypothetical protein
MAGLSHQSHDAIILVLRFVPFTDQITMWQTGDKTWHRLYKVCVQKSPTTLIFDRNFCDKMLSCYMDPCFKIEQKPKSYAFPGSAFAKIPEWIRFNTFICYKTDFATLKTATCNYGYRIPYISTWLTSCDKFKNCIGDLCDVLLRSKSTLSSVYTDVSTYWMFELLQRKDDNGRKIFAVMSDFQCEHYDNCDCYRTSMRLPYSGLFVMGIGHFKKKPDFLIADAETVTTIRMSNCTIDSILNDTFISKIITFIRESVPNLESIEITIDTGHNTKPNTFNEHVKSAQKLQSKNILVKAQNLQKTNYLTGTNFIDVTIPKLVKMFSELGFGFGFCQG